MDVHITMPGKRKLNLHGTGYCASLNVRRAARAVTGLYDVAIVQSGIRSTAFTLLVAIAKAEPVPIGKLGNMLALDPTTLSRSLRLLEERRFIAISPRSTMRQRFLTLRPEGERALARALPFWRRVQDKFEKEIGASRWKRMQKELEKMVRIATEIEASAYAAHP